MTELFFIRHGQSEANLTRHFAGATESPLTPLGIKQAEMTAEFFNDKIPDIVYASPLSRAYNTGLKVAEKFKCEIITDKRLREVSAGLWEGLHYQDIIGRYGEDYTLWKENIGECRCTGGESVFELRERVNEAISEIVSKNEGKRIVIATHATPIRAMETIWRNLPMSEMKNIPWVTNASVTHVNYKNGKGTIIERSIDRHLEGMITSLPANV